MESTKRGGKVCGWCSVLLKSQRKVGGFARWVGVYGRWQLLANRAYKTKWNGKLNRNRKTQMANDSLRTLTQKQSGTVSKESQFIVTDIDFYSGPIPIPFPFFPLFFLRCRAHNATSQLTAPWDFWRMPISSRIEKQLAFGNFACLPPPVKRTTLPVPLNIHLFFMAEIWLFWYSALLLPQPKFAPQFVFVNVKNVEISWWSRLLGFFLFSVGLMGKHFINHGMCHTYQDRWLVHQMQIAPFSESCGES